MLIQQNDMYMYLILYDVLILCYLMYSIRAFVLLISQTKFTIMICELCK